MIQVKNLSPETLQKVLEADMATGFDVAVPTFSGLSIDSRTIKPGEIFFAITGGRNDGHNYVEKAFARGAAAVVISRSHAERFAGIKQGPILVVNDTHEALLNLAGYLRRHFDAHFAAITGSNGKTTTKEMLYSIVRVKHKAFRSPGNLNNLFGLPISLGQMPNEVDYAIFELGISVPGEMSRLTSLIKPELALVTNIGPTHLESLKTIDNVVKAKFELIDRLPIGAIVILNADDSNLMKEAERRKLDYIGFGIESKCQFQAKNIRADAGEGLSFEVGGQKIVLQLFGRVNVYNALAAVTASSVWKCTPEEWAAGLAGFRPVDMRLVLEHHQGLHLLIDCYNANPASVRAALRALKEFETKGRKIAVLGDMLELGSTSKQLHYETGQEVARSKVDYLLCLGPQSEALAEGAHTGGMEKNNIWHFREHQQMLDCLLGLVAREDVILFKGSRGMEMEKIVIGLKGAAFKSN